MELIFAIVILFFLFGGWQELTKPAQAKKYLYTKVIKKVKKTIQLMKYMRRKASKSMGHAFSRRTVYI